MIISISRLKHYFWSIFSVAGIVLLWAGIWEGLGYLPYLENPFISLIVGLVILFSSGLIFKEFDPLDELEENVTKVLSHIYRYPQKHHFRIKYFDRIKQRHIKFSGSIIKKIEKSYLIVKHKSGKELFIPMHRIKKVSKKGKTFWKAKA